MLGILNEDGKFLIKKGRVLQEGILIEGIIVEV